MYFRLLIFSLSIVCATSVGVTFPIASKSLSETSVARDDLGVRDLARVLEVTSWPVSFTELEPFETMPGGKATYTGPVNSGVFSHASPALDDTERLDFELGRSLFEKLWVASPSSTQASDGLGPLYNARSCHGCHKRDGRGNPAIDPVSGQTTLLLRLSSWDELSETPKPDPVYGGQLQPLAVTGLSGEGRVIITYDEIQVPLAGGETAYLRVPTYKVEDLAFGEIATETRFSPRIAPPMTGLGLLEAIHPSDIRAIADPEDADGDGVSGRVAWIEPGTEAPPSIGRFGWKAGQPTVETQTSAAFANDLGISTDPLPLHWGDCTDEQPACLAMPIGVQENLGLSEAPGAVLDLVAAYAANLAVPARRTPDSEEVLQGKAQFYAAGCPACHWPKFVTRRDAGRPENAFQLIWPYTDLLLHDMGEGLSDGSPTAEASAREWRTPPLWGLGLAKTVDDNVGFLHDGRARTILEAILWHGGEGQAARDFVASLSPTERRQLIAFLESL